MIFSYDNYRTYLRDLFASRSPNDPAYSVRAMARRLDVSPAFLSEVLRGLKNFSAEAGMKVARRLGFSINEAEYFCLLVQLETSKNPEYRANLLAKMAKLRPTSDLARSKRKAEDMLVQVDAEGADEIQKVIDRCAAEVLAIAQKSKNHDQTYSVSLLASQVSSA